MNALQLAWAINWENAYTSGGGPTVDMYGPATGTWYNTNQEVYWYVYDTGSGPPTGLAGFTQGWDSIRAIPDRRRPGHGQFLLQRPQYANATDGCLYLTSGGACAGGVSQGWHYAYVEAWNNMGIPTTQYYGPIGYDTVPPLTTASLSGTLVSGQYNSQVTVSLSATDATSGVAAIYYKIGTARRTVTSLRGAVQNRGRGQSRGQLLQRRCRRQRRNSRRNQIQDSRGRKRCLERHRIDLPRAGGRDFLGTEVHHGHQHRTRRSPSALSRSAAPIPPRSPLHRTPASVRSMREDLQGRC